MACWIAVCPIVDSRGIGELNASLFDPTGLRDRFLVLRNFLPGESARAPKLASCGGGLVGKASFSMTVWPLEEDFCDEKDAFREMVGDSGDELGEGSVRVESAVEMVVVGEESVDSDLNVFDDRRRYRYPLWEFEFRLDLLLEDDVGRLEL